MRQGVEDVVAVEPAKKINVWPGRGGGWGVGAMIDWIMLVDDENAIVAGSGIVPEDEVEVAIAFRGTLTWIVTITQHSPKLLTYVDKGLKEAQSFSLTVSSN